MSEQTTEKAQSLAGTHGESGGLYELIVDHPMWDGIDYSPEREAQIGAFLNAADAVIHDRIAVALTEPASALVRHYASYGGMTQQCAHAFHDLITSVVISPGVTA